MPALRVTIGARPGISAALRSGACPGLSHSSQYAQEPARHCMPRIDKVERGSVDAHRLQPLRTRLRGFRQGAALVVAPRVLCRAAGPRANRVRASRHPAAWASHPQRRGLSGGPGRVRFFSASLRPSRGRSGAQGREGAVFARRPGVWLLPGVAASGDRGGQRTAPPFRPNGRRASFLTTRAVGTGHCGNRHACGPGGRREAGKGG